MLEKRILFEGPTKEIVSNREIINLFWNLLIQESKRGEEYTLPEVFLKVGSLFKPMPFDFSVSVSSFSYRKNIQELDDAKFVSDALKAIKNYRNIHDTVYRQLDNREEISEGEYVFAVGDEPRFRLNIEPDKVWIHKKMTFEVYGLSEKKEFFKYLPNLNVNPNNFGMILSVANQKGRKILTGLYRQVETFYKKKGLKVIG